MILALIGHSGTVFASDLPVCPSSGSFHNCFGTHTFTNSDKYVGEYKDNNMHGQGIYAFANGNKYVGEFKDNMMHGRRTVTDANGRIINEGIWDDDEFQYAKKVGPKT